MDIQKFIQDNVPNVEAREEFAKYKTLKECLADPKLYDRKGGRRQECKQRS